MKGERDGYNICLFAHELKSFSFCYFAPRSMRLGDFEHARAKRWEAEQKTAIKTREDQILELKQTAEKQIAATQIAHANAALKANNSSKKAMDTLNEAERLKKEKWEHRVEAVLELRDNQNAVRAKAATDAEKRANKLAAAAKELEDQKAGLLARGLNPYAEFRRREIDAQDDALEKRLKDAVELNKADLAVRLIREEDQRRKRDEAEAIEKEYEKKQRDELGRHVIEARNRDYIASVTLDGREMLDPSGRASRVDPSQITSFPDYSLGLGKSSRITPSNMKNITERIRRKLDVDKSDLGEYQRMIGPLKEYAEQMNENQLSATSLGGMERSQSAPSGEQEEQGLSSTELPPHTASASRQFDRKAIDMLNTLGGKRGNLPGRGEIVSNVNAQPEGELELLMQLAQDENGSMQEDNAPLSTLSPKYKINAPSKFEKDALKRAQNRMQTRRVEGVTQVAAGKTFKGHAFVSSPAVLTYKDFQVGKIYRKKFILTNVSYSFNSFQLLPLKDDIIDFFEIKYEKPGRMSAGTSCSLEITFTPKINEDIFGFVQLLSQTGPIDIPLQCLKKRCIPRVLTTAMDFGEVVMGQIVKQQITIKNSGALATFFTVSPLMSEGSDVEIPVAENVMGSPRSPRNNEMDSSSSTANKPKPYGQGDPALNDGELSSRNRLVMTEMLRRKKQERPHALAIEPTGGTDASLGGDEMITCRIEGYSSITVDVICAPLSLGFQERQFRFVFAEVKDSDQSVDESGEVVNKEQRVRLTVTGEVVPVFVGEEDIDFRTVLHNRIYRSKFVLKNRGRSTYRADINIPSPMNKYIEVSPNSLFVQADSSQIVNVKFTPTPTMLEQMAYFMLPNESFEDTSQMKLPLEIKVTNQDLPVYCVLNSVLTSSKVNISTESEGIMADGENPLVLDFDKIYVNQCATRGLTLKNSSILPQKIAFVRLRKEVSVQPNDGFAVLLPNESMTFNVTFTALSAIKYDLQLEVATSQNDLYTLKVQATGIESPFEISNAVIKLRSTCPGQRVLESTMITNTTQKKQIFEMSIPESVFSWIKVSPLICELGPGDSKRLEFEFLPPEGVMEQDPLEWHNNIMFPPEPEKTPEPEPLPEIVPAAKGKTKGKGPVVIEEVIVEKKAPEPPKPKHVSPFNTWTFDDGWVRGAGPYGGIQWTKPIREDSASIGSNEIGEDGGGGPTIPPGNSDDHSAVNGEEFHGPDDIAANSFASTAAEEQELAVPTPGYIGEWAFPLYIKTRGSKGMGTTSSVANAIDTCGDGHSSLPMFIKVQSVVVSNQYDIDTPSFDFGQISLGTRLIRTLKFRNNMTGTVKLTAQGLNAVGPFAILNAVREVPAAEWISVVIECNPLTAGLFNECIEFAGVNGGHHMRVPLRVQGVNPTVELHGLRDNSKVGKYLDFGNVVADDKATKSFTIVNTSAFPVAIYIQRTVANGLAPRKQAETVERNMSGLPVFTFTPEHVVIPEGAKVDVTLCFHPDRYRVLPYREDLDITVGQGTNDLPIKVHVTGRARSRQVFVTTAAPKDEAFYSQDFGISFPEDPLSVHRNSEVRLLAKQSYQEIGALVLPDKPIVLEYPDPYRSDITDEQRAAVEVESAEAASLFGAGGKGAVAPTSSSRESSITQLRRVIVSAAVINDVRGGGALVATYEFVLSQEARDSGLFTVGVNAKGNCVIGTDIPVAIGCTLPRPKGLGGLQVGSWQMFKADMVLKGGWKPEGEPEEYTVPVLLKGFVRL